jgi:hypothetical protein
MGALSQRAPAPPEGEKIVDPYRSLCEADAKLLLRLELEDVIAMADVELARLRQDLRRAVSPKVRSEIVQEQRGLIESKAVLVRKLADDTFYVPRANRSKPSTS